MAYINFLTQRNKLHHQLVEVENKPCLDCVSNTPFYKREIHRVRHGGEYTLDNVRVRCFNCHHFIDHPNSKFRVGERVVLNGRTPQHIDLPRHRPRTIIAIIYNKQKQCNYYLLGCNSRGSNSGQGNPLNGFNDYLFRSYMMIPYQPRLYHFKRNYRRVR